MNMESSFQGEDTVGFVKTLSQLLTYLNIEHHAYQWGEFLSKINPESTHDTFISTAENIFDIYITPIDLHNLMPSEQGYLIKNDSGWHFMNDVNQCDTKKNNAYQVRKKHQEKLNISFSFTSILRNKNLMMIFIISFFINIFALTSPLYFNAIYGRIIPSAAESSLWTLSIIAFFCFFCEFLLKKSKMHYGFKAMEAYKNNIQPEILNRVIRKTHSFDNQWGKDKEIALRDLKELGILFWGIISTNFFDVFFVLIFLFVIYLMAGALVIVPIISLLILLGIGFYYAYYLKEKKFPYLQAITSSTIDCYQMNGVDSRLSSVNFMNENNLYQYNQHTHSEKQGLSSLLAFISSVQSIFITVLAFYLIQHNDISIASLFAVIILSSRVSQSMVSFIHSIPMINKIHAKIKSLNKFIENTAQKEITSFNDNVNFKWVIHDVSLAFEKSHPLFKNINIQINKGEKVAFIGHQGSGKTVLSKMVMGLILPETGQITVQDQDGHQIPFNQISQRVHYQSQWPMLLGESFMTHLCAEQAFPEMICKKALSVSYLKWLPPLLSNGLYTLFHHLPFELSPVQKQMLSLPRFALTQRDIWLFDEPLHLVDNGVKQQFIQLAKSKMTPETTLLLFADNLQYIDLVDRVVAFNQGKMIFDGPKSDFLQQYAYVKPQDKKDD
ncbi:MULTISPECIES: ATP-binding cassette domain-containing protein [Providencia]|uniref:ATP-binding cassette domain-containing protein n=5 Tax=Providencia rettgeri TaxID=587 RepID=A0AAP2JX11_PRORE|nr:MULTISPECIES: ATP-binding cassette domain-containing protein [Providencia]EJD6509251.1 ATP-binding cassette domain-containing protein [Providencia rettgeri]ELR5134713.1 ATP-binding cassette domain-containing protein [Providencia rettgeri]ELR5169732.1 ATP-binding cassette domain-containing protein [Providencia rettgeri]MBQ0209424.1 ATP-binding cassette domain-containing protein [Providencia rettgeri]MBQ0324980.1 ATP-binding cassette domain-containing protein [Providencia rettgeri]